MKFLNEPTKENIIASTEAVKAMLEVAWKNETDVDKEMKRHIVFVFNHILINTKKLSYSKENLEASGKLLYRLIRVWGAYKKKKGNQNLNRQEFLDKFSDLAEEVKTIWQNQ